MVLPRRYSSPPQRIAASKISKKLSPQKIDWKLCHFQKLTNNLGTILTKFCYELTNCKIILHLKYCEIMWPFSDKQLWVSDFFLFNVMSTDRGVFKT